MNEQKLTWFQWQKTNWWWIPCLLAIVFSVAGFKKPYDFVFWVWQGLFVTVFLLCLIKGIILGWLEYKNGKRS